MKTLLLVLVLCFVNTQAWNETNSECREWIVAQRCRDLPDQWKPIVKHKKAYSIQQIAEEILLPLQDSLGCHIILTSGHRTPYWNKRVGGWTKSWHLKGRALDFVVPDCDHEYVMNILRGMDFEYLQLYNEKDHIHIAI